MARSKAAHEKKDGPQHNHEGAPNDTIPTCPVCHYPGWAEDEAYEAERLRMLDILDGVDE